MTHLKFTAQLESGRRVEFTPQNVKPLTLAELRGSKGEHASYRMFWGVNEVMIDGNLVDLGGAVNSTVTLQRTPRPFALVPGGWLPLPLATPARFLVDRNIISDLIKLRRHPERIDVGERQWWMNLTDHGGVLFNPLTYAWEGQGGRTPDEAEFVRAFELGVAEIGAALPGTAIVKYGPVEHRAAHEIRVAFGTNAHKEATFLRGVCPMLVDRVRPGREAPIEASIFDHCARQGLEPNSLACVAALSCLYKDRHGSAHLIGREVLKPTRD